MKNTAAKQYLLAGIARGERAILEGKVLTQAQAKRRMRRWLKLVK